MKKWIQILLLLLFVQHSLQAQLGAAITGISTIGTGMPPIPVIGKAATARCASPGSCGRARVTYTFKGAGNWNIEGNWYGNAIPPPLLRGHAQIVIDPAGTAECVFTVPIQIIPPGTNITVLPGKKLRVLGRLVK